MGTIYSFISSQLSTSIFFLAPDHSDRQMWIDWKASQRRFSFNAVDNWLICVFMCVRYLDVTSVSYVRNLISLSPDSVIQGEPSSSELVLVRK